MIPAQVWVATLQCVAASQTITACDLVLDTSRSLEALAVAGPLKVESVIALGKASLALVDGGASVLDAARAVIRERSGF